MKRNELFKGNERRNCYEVQIKIFNFVYLYNFKLNNLIVSLGFLLYYDFSFKLILRIGLWLLNKHIFAEVQIMFPTIWIQQSSIKFALNGLISTSNRITFVFMLVYKIYCF